MDTDDIWFKNPQILIDRVVEFVPMPDMTFNEKLNSFVRFSFITALFLILYNKNYYILLFPIFAIGITIYFGRIKQKNNFENIMFDNGIGDFRKCSLPTEENPYMNLILTDFEDNIDKQPACDVSNPVVKSLIKKYDFKDLRNVGDVYNVAERGNRFYTLPSTTPSQIEREDFANFVYKINKKTCKEDSTKCQPYEDIRYNRSTNI